MKQYTNSNSTDGHRNIKYIITKKLTDKQGSNGIIAKLA